MNSASKLVATVLSTTLTTGASAVTVIVSLTVPSGSTRSSESAEASWTRMPSWRTAWKPSSAASTV